MTPRTPAPITAAELELLRLLWQEGRASIRELTEHLFPDGGRSRYATVQVLLDRLESKGLVTRHREGRAHTFTPRMSRGEVLRQRLRELADRFCGGATAPLLSQLLPSERLTEEERELLDRLLARLDGEEP